MLHFQKKIIFVFLSVIAAMLGFIILYGYYMYFYESRGEKEYINQKIQLFLEYEKVASATSRIVLSNRISSLVEIKNEIKNIKTSYPCNDIKAIILDDMEMIINHYNLFLADIYSDNIGLQYENELYAAKALLQLTKISQYNTCKDYIQAVEEQERKNQIQQKKYLDTTHKIIHSYIDKLQNLNKYQKIDFEISQNDKNNLNKTNLGKKFINDMDNLKSNCLSYMKYKTKNNSSESTNICDKESQQKLDKIIQHSFSFMTDKKRTAKPFVEKIVKLKEQIEIKLVHIIPDYSGYTAEYIITNNSPYTIASMSLENGEYHNFRYVSRFSFYRQNADREEFSGLPPNASIKIRDKISYDIERDFAGDKLREYRKLKADKNVIIKNKKDYYNKIFVVYKNVKPTSIQLIKDESHNSKASISKEIKYIDCTTDAYLLSLDEKSLRERPSDGELTCWLVTHKNKTIKLDTYPCDLSNTECIDAANSDYLENKDIFGIDFLLKELSNDADYKKLKDEIIKQYSSLFNINHKDLTDVNFALDSQKMNIFVNNETIDIETKYNQACYEFRIKELVKDFIINYKN